MFVRRTLRPALRPFVATLWASEAGDGADEAGRELVLPTGAAHIVLRLSGDPLRLFDGPDDPVGRTVGLSVVGGPRDAPYVRARPRPERTVGAQLRSGAADLLLGLPADEVAGRHVALEDLWGRAFVSAARERLAAARTTASLLDAFEDVLTMRVPQVRGVHPAVALALERFARGEDVRSVVLASGYSHGRFIEVFKRGVGLSPKVYSRVVRFQTALARAAAEPGATWTALALDTGYSDQAHFNREFRAFAGVTPGAYRALAPAQAHHVPVPDAPPDARRARVEFRSIPARPAGTRVPGRRSEP